MDVSPPMLSSLVGRGISSTSSEQNGTVSVERFSSWNELLLERNETERNGNETVNPLHIYIYIYI